jgi:hypothetical protein
MPQSVAADVDLKMQNRKKIYNKEGRRRKKIN